VLLSLYHYVGSKTINNCANRFIDKNRLVDKGIAQYAFKAKLCGNMRRRTGDSITPHADDQVIAQLTREAQEAQVSRVQDVEVSRDEDGPGRSR
jgi:hypothetical protein